MFKNIKIKILLIFVLFNFLSFEQKTNGNFSDYFCFSWCSSKTCFWCSDVQLAEVHLNQGEKFESQGKIKEAENEFREAVRLNPKSAKAHFNLGVTILNLNQKEENGKKEIEKEFKEAIKLDPQLAITLNLGASDKAQKESQELINLNFEDAMLHLNLGETFYQLKQTEKAITEYKKSIKLNPDLINPHLKLGLFYELNKNVEAEKEFQEIIRISPDLKLGHFLLGLSFFNRNEYIKAKQEFRHIIRKDSDCGMGHLLLGVVLFKIWVEKNIKISEKKIKVSLKKIKISGKKIIGLDVQDSERELKEAKKELEEAEKELEEAKGKELKETEKEFNEVCRIVPNSALAHCCLALLFASSDRNIEAKNEYGLASKLINDDDDNDYEKMDFFYVFTHLILGDTLAALENWDEAYKELGKVSNFSSYDLPKINILNISADKLEDSLCNNKLLSNIQNTKNQAKKKYENNKQDL
jgi:tetratricopeptide (TPR) repeat protein